MTMTMTTMMITSHLSVIFAAGFLLLLTSSSCCVAAYDTATTCSADMTATDPNLVEMTYDVGDGEQTFMAYVEPDIWTFYRTSLEDDESVVDKSKYQKVVPKFNGLAGKFINMSNQRIAFFWESKKNGPAHLMRYYDPFSTGGTGTFPGHRFFFTPENDKENRIHEFVIEEYPNNLYIYDPYLVKDDPIQTEQNLKNNLSTEERIKYDKWIKTLKFNDIYYNTTGRMYLSNYGDSYRKPPSHFMWPANYFGEEHWVTTQETHFVSMPPQDQLGKVTVSGSARKLKADDPRILHEYRVPNQSMMNMTLKVLSIAPRVYEIENFLSDVEVQHILELAGGIELKESTTGDVGSNSATRTVSNEEQSRSKTRTSFNSWVPRENSPIIDAIYRRSADLMRIDEALLRARSADEYPDFPTKKSISETLQLVHYGPGQEYTAHHDFGYSNIDDNRNGARFSTLLFYLNDGMEGGETSFPRYVNAESFHKLKVTPKSGKAVLFYSQLPDGNMDDFSQHAAEPIVKGEKWLINLWTWDPVYEK